MFLASIVINHSSIHKQTRFHLKYDTCLINGSDNYDKKNRESIEWLIEIRIGKALILKSLLLLIKISIEWPWHKNQKKKKKR